VPKPEANQPKVYSEPLTRYTNYFVAATLRMIGYYDPERRSWPVIKRMRKYPQIKFGLNLMKWAVLSTSRSVKCDDPDVRAFVETQFVKPHLTRMLNVNLSALDYGFAPAELRWALDPTLTDFSPVGAFTIQEIRDPDPQFCFPVVDEFGDYQGFEQWGAGGRMAAIPADASTWFTFLQEHGRWFGIPWTDACYDDWYRAVLMATWMAQEAERHGGPFTTVRFPTTPVADDPANAANLARAEELGKNTRSLSYVALPNNADASGKYAWEVDRKIEHATGRAWIEKLNWLQTQMFRAIGIPDLVATQTEIGSRALGETQKSMVYMGFDALNERLDTFTTEHAIKKFVTYNIPDAPAVTLVSEKLQDDRREFILAVYKDAVNEFIKADPQGALAQGIIKDLENYGIKAEDETEPAPDQPAGEGDVEE